MTTNFNKGSENNTCYLYCNELSKPLLSYKFDDCGVAKKDDAMNDFVSAVCWDNVREKIEFKLNKELINFLMIFFIKKIIE